MADITPAEVEHLATLARIDLDPAARERMAHELADIQHLIEKVREVATPDVPPTKHPLSLGNVTRPDVPGETLSQADALAGAPDSDGTRFRVTAILGEE